MDFESAAILGNGASGKAAEALLRNSGVRTTVLDGDDRWPEGKWDVCVASPGIPPGHPWIASAREKGVLVISELQLGAERYLSLGGRMLAVTGSKGKSSVVKLVADAIGGIPCGNYGRPLCDVALEFSSGEKPPPWAVVEVSSFQLETTSLPHDAFAAAAVLNLQEDHLDRHGTVVAYHALKRGLLDFAKTKIDGTAIHPAENDLALMEGSYFSNSVLQTNGLSAIALMRAAGLGDSAIKESFSGFEPLPHRMQKILEKNGVEWIDDSKSTSIASLIAGVEMAASRPPCKAAKILLIAGGLAKGDDPAAALPALANHAKKVFLIGDSATAFNQAWSGTVPCETCGTLERAVEAAAASAAPGECVLLSPGTASFDQFKGYAERGRRFAECAMNLVDGG